MRGVSVSLSFSLVLAATLPALAGESPYNPGAPPIASSVRPSLRARPGSRCSTTRATGKPYT